MAGVVRLFKNVQDSCINLGAQGNQPILATLKKYWILRAYLHDTIVVQLFVLGYVENYLVWESNDFHVSVLLIGKTTWFFYVVFFRVWRSSLGMFIFYYYFEL